MEPFISFKQPRTSHNLAHISLGDLPMSRVKFGTKHEYEYLANYKVLQNCFISHKVDKVKTTNKKTTSDARYAEKSFSEKG